MCTLWGIGIWVHVHKLRAGLCKFRAGFYPKIFFPFGKSETPRHQLPHCHTFRLHIHTLPLPSLHLPHSHSPRGTGNTAPAQLISYACYTLFNTHYNSSTFPFSTLHLKSPLFPSKYTSQSVTQLTLLYSWDQELYILNHHHSLTQLTLVYKGNIAVATLLLACWRTSSSTLPFCTLLLQSTS